MKLVRIKNSLPLFIFLIHFISIAQIQLKGKVVSSKTPIAWANIVLTNPDKEIVFGAITEDDGNFIIDIDQGTYTIAISYIGYINWTKEIDIKEDMDLGVILLKEQSNQLDEVVITSKKRVIERKTDRIVFNVENSISASIGDALSALRVAPGITIQKNAINIIGKGASKIMIDGRILELSEEELVNYLNSIAANDIKKIEIITTPPAKYEAAGNGGLINIIYKKGVLNSWKNSTSVAYNQNTYNFITLRNSFLYNKNKFRFSATVNGSKGNHQEIERLDALYPSGPWLLNLNNKASNDNISARIAADYDLTDRLTVGAQYLGTNSNPDIDVRSTTQIFNTLNELDSLLINNNPFNRDITSHTANFHVIKSLDTLGRQISLDIDYFKYDNTSIQNNLVNTIAPNGDFLGINLANNNFSDQKINNISAKVDIEHPFSKINISYGAKLSYSKSNNDLENFTTETGVAIFDPLSSNQFEYTENTQALYANGIKNIGKSWELQLGLRFENTNTEGVSRTLQQTNKNQYFKLFPSLYVTYRKNDNHNFSFNYGKRIQRPSFRNLNPFRIFVNSNSFSEGNPFLQPSFSDNFEFNHTYKNKLTTNAFLNIQTDGFGSVFNADEETEIFSVTRQNYFKSYRAGIGESFSFNPLPWLKSQNQLYLIGSKTSIDSSINAVTQNGVQLRLSTNNTFILGKNTQLQANFQYNSAQKTNFFDITENYGLDISFQQHLFQKKINLSLSLQDIFNTASRSRLSSTINGVETIFSQNYSSRSARLSLSYNFGNNKISNKQRSFGNKEEQQRSN